MEYTPQQLMGHSCYHPRVRIGNWSEDLELEQARLQFFLKQKDEGNLPSHVMKRKFEQHTAPCKLTPLRTNEEDKHVVQFGDRVMLFNQKTRAFLCSDLDMKLHSLRDRFGVTSAEQKGPVSRAVFIIDKPNRPHNDYDRLYNSSEGSHESHILHYGQSFVLRTVPELGGPYYLRSELVSHSSASPISSFQEVSIDVDMDQSTAWICDYINPQYRIEYEGEPVRGNRPLLVRHVMTNQLLGSGAQKMVLNDFGNEHEVYCKTLMNVRKVEDDANVWCLVYDKPLGDAGDQI